MITNARPCSWVSALDSYVYGSAGCRRLCSSITRTKCKRCSLIPPGRRFWAIRLERSTQRPPGTFSGYAAASFATPTDHLLKSLAFAASSDACGALPLLGWSTAAWFCSDLEAGANKRARTESAAPPANSKAADTGARPGLLIRFGPAEEPCGAAHPR